MKFISFHPFRTIGIPNVTYIKPEETLKNIDVINSADLLLFPERWQLPILVHGLKKKIFPSYESIVLGHNKIDMTRALQAMFPNYFPYTEIKANTKKNKENILNTFAFPFVAKESRNSMGQGVYLIKSHDDFEDYCNKTDVLYIQEYLPSDREVRVVVIGNEIVAAYWKVADSDQFHHNITKGGKVSFDAVPIECTDLVSKIAQAFNINHAGFDVLLINGHPFVIEFNTLFGNQGVLQSGKRVEDHIYQHIMKEHFQPTPTAPVGGKIIS